MILWLDPGETTGWAAWDRGIFQSDQLGFQDTGWLIESTAKNDGSLLSIGWEAFIISALTARKPGSHWAIEVIGVARYFALVHGATILPAYPSSSLPKDTIRDRQLKSIGWHKPGRTHANDAACHLMHYMLASRNMPSAIAKELAGGNAAKDGS
jgi:hypothetical protein